MFKAEIARRIAKPNYARIARVRGFSPRIVEKSLAGSILTLRFVLLKLANLPHPPHVNDDTVF